MTKRFYPIGTPGQAWTETEREQWRAKQTTIRSYADDVLHKLSRLDRLFETIQYGALSIDPKRYPLMAIRPVEPNPQAPWALITGGVHGYETSGVQGALSFILEDAPEYAERLNFLIAPCISPWAYEVINRWNPRAIDPNRSFMLNNPLAEESAALMSLIDNMESTFVFHIDLHETTDTDESEFRPALAARDGEEFQPGIIPDGFYTVGDAANPQLDFQQAIITGVEAVTHIAPADDRGQIIGSDVVRPGVILYDFKKLGLCAGITNARYTTTTEVYPDSPHVSPQICNTSQVAAIRTAVSFVLTAAETA